MTILQIIRSAPRFLLPTRQIVVRIMMTMFTVAIVLCASSHPLVATLWQAERSSLQDELIVDSRNQTGGEISSGPVNRFCPERKAAVHPLYTNLMDFEISHAGCASSLLVARVMSMSAVKAALRNQSSAEILKGMAAALLTRPPRAAIL